MHYFVWFFQRRCVIGILYIYKILYFYIYTHTHTHTHTLGGRTGGKSHVLCSVLPPFHYTIFHLLIKWRTQISTQSKNQVHSHRLDTLTGKWTYRSMSLAGGKCIKQRLDEPVFRLGQIPPNSPANRQQNHHGIQMLFMCWKHRLWKNSKEILLMLFSFLLL